MESGAIDRRKFLQTTVSASVIAFSVSSFFNVFGAKAPSKPSKNIYECGICGHIEFGITPAFCPICRSPKEKFEMNNTIFSESATKFKDTANIHSPIIIAKKKSPLVTEKPSISVQIKIGKTIHPATEKHRIRFVDCYIDDVYVGCMLPTIHSYPAGGMEIRTPGSVVRVVTLCNKHGYWQSEAAIA